MLLKSIQLLCILALSTLSVFAVSKQKSFPEAAQKGAFFRENKGQVKDQNWQPRPDVLFSGESNGLTYHLKKDGLHYQLSRVDSWKDETEERGLKHPGKESHKVPDQMSLYRVDITWLGANPFCEIITGEARPDYENFYNVPEGVEPALFVKSYASVTYKNLYENIDLKFYQTPNGELEYDFIVHPGGDYKKIQLDIKGATLSLNQKQELEITTPLGTITEGTLKVHQEGKIINAVWVLNNENTVSYQIENYNPAADLTIDPPVRLWGTYYGGSDSDYGYSCTTDVFCNVYLAGMTLSTTAIATTGAHQTTHGLGADALLVKFDSFGTRLWGTYYGGNAADGGHSCTTDATGDVYLVGFTSSTNAISTLGAHQSTNGGSYDAYLVKFDSSGTRIWGTYYGGTDEEICYSCKADTSGHVYLTGTTYSSNAISTSGAHQTTIGSNYIGDAFLVKFNSAGTRLWGTYYGGNDDEQEGYCTIDKNDNVYMAGTTTSSFGIATAGTHQSTIGGSYDAYLVKFDSSGTRLWGTYYGGSNFEYGFSCSTDNYGSIYLVGETESPDSIATTTSHQSMLNGLTDGFIVKFDTLGLRLWGTYLGGRYLDRINFSTIDCQDNVYVAGTTTSGNGIATQYSHQTIIGGNGCRDAFLVRFESSGICTWGTYYGGSNHDEGYSCAIDSNGKVYLTGNAGSTNSISTIGSHQTIQSGGYDAFLVKFDGTGSATGLEQTQTNSSPFILSPNPGQNQLTISGLPEGTIYDLTILNTLGQVVFTSPNLHDSENVKITLPNGLYEVIVETKDERYAQKWVVE